ncbi:MAG: pimeloyl-ACP methyl ester esterase BioH [Methylococcaceae bacterium]|nr:pimeloyl-ACP methyl ester esterase BioH [Methylococcaceae bacterium]
MPPLHQQTFGSGPPLVLVHGWAMHSGIWQNFALHLAKHYQVTCIDLPGHGLSAPLANFTLSAVSDALVAAITTPHSVWLGWSLGATIVLDIAQRYPERVKAALLLAGNPHFTESPVWPGMNPRVLDSFAEHLQADSTATLVRFLSLQVNNLDNAKTLLKTLKQAILSRPAADAASLQGGLNVLKHSDLRTAFATNPQPTAVILGAWDTLVPISVGDAMQQLAPHRQITRVEKAGHALFLSHPDTIVQALAQLLESPCA